MLILCNLILTENQASVKKVVILKFVRPLKNYGLDSGSPLVKYLKKKGSRKKIVHYFNL